MKQNVKKQVDFYRVSYYNPIDDGKIYTVDGFSYKFEAGFLQTLNNQGKATFVIPNVNVIQIAGVCYND